MDKQQLEAIRARDADYNDVFEAQASMSKDIAHRLVAWPVADRRALLAYVDALREAARKVTCERCNGVGRSINQRTHLHEPCPHCGDLRALLPEEGT